MLEEENCDVTQQDDGAPENMDTDTALISQGEDETVVSDGEPDGEPNGGQDDEEMAADGVDVGEPDDGEENPAEGDDGPDESKPPEVATSEEEEIAKPKHPYESELENFKPNSWQCEKLDPQKCGTLEEGKYTYVDTEELLDEMMSKLKEVKEIAIDVEHHSYRSYKGIVCLVQISTRSEDFLVDSLQLKEHLNVLNEVCTNKDIVKVLHGSERDITWLQRDFGIYIINMFDTQLAAKVLKEEMYNLARLLNKYCSVTVDKKYQMADWRTRPLPDEMVTYARQDTHYLLYLYDLYRNLLLVRGDALFNLLHDVYTQSAKVCLQVYVFQPDTYLRAYKKCKGQLNQRQMDCFRLLHEWRNKVASEKDESTGYTLPNKMMFSISKRLPRDEKALSDCCSTVPELVKENMEEVIKLVEQSFTNVPVITDKVVDKGVKEKKSTKKLSAQERIQAIKNSKLKRRISKRQWCLECGIRGHWATDCPAKRNRSGPRPPFLMKVGPPAGGQRGGMKMMRGRGSQPYPGPRNVLHPSFNNHSRPMMRGEMPRGVVDYRTRGGPFGGEMNPYGQGGYNSYNGPRQFNQPAPRAMNPFNRGPRGYAPRGASHMPPPHYDPYYQW